MSDALLKRLERVQNYFVREGLGFDDYCIATEEAIALLRQRKSLIIELKAMLGAFVKRYHRLDHLEEEADEYAELISRAKTHLSRVVGINGP